MILDGVKMNNLIYRAGHLQDIVKTDPLMMERLEVLFGPSTTIFGSDALGGVIYMKTKSPTFSNDDHFKMRTELFTGYSSAANAFNAHANINYGNRRWAGLTAFSFVDFDDLKSGTQQNPFADTLYGLREYYVGHGSSTDSLIKNDNDYIQRFSGYSQYDLIQKLSFRQNDKIQHNLNIQYSTSSDVPRYDRLTDPNDKNVLNSAEWYYGPQKRLLAAYDVNIQTAFLDQFQIGLNYQNLEESRHNRNFRAPAINHRIENVQVIGININGLKKWTKHELRFGLDAQLNDLKSTANKENISNGSITKLDTRYPDGINKMNNLDLYWSHLWKMHKRWHVVDGFRIGYSSLHSTLVDTALLFRLPYTDIKQNTPVYSGNIGLLYFPNEQLKLSFLTSSGFRVPNVDDLAKIFGTSRGKVIVPNKDLKPEKTLNYDLGIQYVFSDKVNFEQHVYYTDFYDIAVVDSFQLNGQDYIIYDDQLTKVFANQNRDRAFIYGYSGTLTNRWTSSIKSILSLNYTFGRLKTTNGDVPLDHIPPLNFRAAVDYAKNKWNADITFNYAASKKLKDYSTSGEDNLQYATEDGMPAWMCFDLHAKYDLNSRIALKGGIENILDTQYRTFASGINAPGRNFIVGIRIKL